MSYPDFEIVVFGDERGKKNVGLSVIEITQLCLRAREKGFI